MTLLAGAVVLSLVGWLLMRTIHQASKYGLPVMLTVALSIVTLLALAGGVFTDHESAYTIAAAGIGALAGSLTAVFHAAPNTDYDQPDHGVDSYTELVETADEAEEANDIEERG